LAGKLLSKWEGPFIIEEVYRSCAIKIASLKDNTTQVVVGMTSRVGQGQSRLLADFPRISTALSQEDRLRPKDRLRQQLASDFTEESQSRRRRRNSSNGCFAKRSLAPIRSTEAGTSVTLAMPSLHQSMSRSLHHERIRGRTEGICLGDAGPRGKGTL
jgi:hypothetical protein